VRTPVVWTDLDLWRKELRALKARHGTIGFVPTMGALHAGHGSLLARSRAENDVSVLSIYVNPTQFENKDDLQRYPLSLERDHEAAARAGVDHILEPSAEQIYADGYRYKVSEQDFSARFCGAHRPGHFDGVLTVVMKLLNLVRADRAYFGEKDFQQLELVKDMVAAFFMDTEIVGCPTVRESDGLALSSRNVNLSSAARTVAPEFVRALREARSAGDARSQLERAGFEVDYVEDFGARRLGAVKIGGVRLIDNVQI
jgi:pantoate--beta-alanine ligase